MKILPIINIGIQRQQKVKKSIDNCSINSTRYWLEEYLLHEMCGKATTMEKSNISKYQNAL